MNRIYITVFLIGLICCFSSCKENKDQTKKVDQKERQLSVKESLEYKLKLPEIDNGEPLPLLIFLHGYGSNELDSDRFAQSFDQRYLVYSVKAPYKIGEAKYKWFDFKRDGEDFIYSYDQMNESVDRIIDLLYYIKQKHHIDDSKIIIGGFSQGAMMSLAVSLRHSELFSGAMILSGDLLDEIEEEIKDLQIDKKLDIYISHGRQDQRLTFAEAVKDIKFLKAKGIDVYEFYYDSGHTISNDNFVSLSKWLSAKIDQ